MVPCAREPRRPLASLSLSLPLTRACLASESIFPVTLNLKSDPGPWQPRAGRRGVCGDKNFGSRKNCDAGEIWSKTFGGGARVQRRQGGEPGEPAARSVETAAARVTRQRRRGRAGGFDEMSTAMDRYIEVVKQYPGQQQADLAVEIEFTGLLDEAVAVGPLPQ